MDVLVRIKRLVLRGAVRFTEKARDEMDRDNLAVDDVIEAVLNARAISKVLRSTSPFARKTGEKLYVIKSTSFDGTPVYTKGAIVTEDGTEAFYIFVSCKNSTDGR